MLPAGDLSSEWLRCCCSTDEEPPGAPGAAAPTEEEGCGVDEEKGVEG
jgi:hypothetical protein